MKKQLNQINLVEDSLTFVTTKPKNYRLIYLFNQNDNNA